MAKTMDCELISWPEIQHLCHRLTTLIRESGYHPEIVIAIGRGGYVPARLVCDQLDIMALTSIKIEHYLSGSERLKKAAIRYPLCTDIKDLRVLLVDDVNDSGDTLELAMQHLNTFQPREIRNAVLHHKTTTRFPVDYCAKKIIRWRWLIYPWSANEDLSNFLQRLSPPPKTLAQAQQLLAEHYNIKVPQKYLKGIYTQMDSAKC